MKKRSETWWLLRLQKTMRDEIKLRGKLSAIAISKSETAMLERMETSNGKYELMKEQASKFATKDEVGVLYRFMYMAIGAIAIIQLIGVAVLIKYFGE